MPHVVTEPCRDCKYTDCVTECPVECFYQDGDMLVIDPNDCIDCGACIPACPVEAIYSESSVPSQWQGYVNINLERAGVLKGQGKQLSKKQPPMKGPNCKGS